ncbi:response regulator [Heliobacterium gestii]|uniref:Stage 0 sporulation protein A homolog n=1 Tax=Heliomicrobium gestii TaxID=2699 RepID=A0A845LCG6_HELGE|nr:response regulator transcription factor [Heliomicrobium gestii]MBM7868328.1 DNA-binding response OmpR family regulator [Heliomicrobium gestii]MZP44517.1 response regulator [Heliomicrobium gestii]
MEPTPPGSRDANGPPLRILLADDDPELRELVAGYLEHDGYAVLLAAHGEEALRLARAERPDLVILDVMMPKLNGLDVCRMLRDELECPLFILSARGDEPDRILGLNLGAIDYVAKPFSPRELVARVNAHLRRRSRQAPVESPIVIGPLCLDPICAEAKLNDVTLDLRAKEWELLRLFAAAPGRVYTKQQVYEQVWHEPYYGNDNTIMVHIRSLRRKLDEALPGAGEWLENIRGLGYRLKTPAPPCSSPPPPPAVVPASATDSTATPPSAPAPRSLPKGERP